jgi:hypothetical protein
MVAQSAAHGDRRRACQRRQLLSQSASLRNDKVEPRITQIRADKYERGARQIRADPRNPRLISFGYFIQLIGPARQGQSEPADLYQGREFQDRLIAPTVARPNVRCPNAESAPECVLIITRSVMTTISDTAELTPGSPAKAANPAFWRLNPCG